MLSDGNFLLKVYESYNTDRPDGMTCNSSQDYCMIRPINVLLNTINEEI